MCELTSHTQNLIPHVSSVFVPTLYVLLIATPSIIMATPTKKSRLSEQKYLPEYTSE